MFEEKPKRRLSAETRAKISAARRARTKQPRQGQSKRIQTFYGELKKDYANSPEALEWIENNKFMLDDREYTKENGLLTEYDNMYFDFYEFKIANIIFGKRASGSEQEEMDHGLVTSDEEKEE